MTVILLYIPVLHRGYLDFLEHHGDATDLLIPGPELIRDMTFLEPEIRAISPKQMRLFIERSKVFPGFVRLVEASDLRQYDGAQVITANEAISTRIVKAHLSKSEVTYDTIFLRWDEASVLSQAPTGFDRTSSDSFDVETMSHATKLAGNSGDWWRQVGAVVTRGWQIQLESFNHHVPSQLAPYAEGDPRDFVIAGTNTELATAMHAEQSIIAQAAKRGLSLDGVWLYVTVFPCPVCAKLVAYSGIKRVYFATGHASLDGQRILKDNGVEIINVPLQPA
jgi:dCMP deaminase